jgi:hypothetical protein
MICVSKTNIFAQEHLARAIVIYFFKPYNVYGTIKRRFVVRSMFQCQNKVSVTTVYLFVEIVP